VMQSLSRQGQVNPLVENYGHVIVDECHHVGAASTRRCQRQSSSTRKSADDYGIHYARQCGSSGVATGIAIVVVAAEPSLLSA